MSVLNIKPVPTQFLSNVSGPYGGAPAAGVTWSVTRAVFYNSDSIPHVITFGCVPTSGSSTTGNTMASRTLQPKETYVSPELAGLTMVTGDQVYAAADLASVVTFTMSANQISP